jgi:hypothetical protein
MVLSLPYTVDGLRRCKVFKEKVDSLFPRIEDYDIIF